jgi:hypothetical protein
MRITSAVWAINLVLLYNSDDTIKNYLSPRKLLAAMLV